MAGIQTPELSSPVSELLLRWQELRQAGRRVSADELCSDRPELVEELREQMAAFESMEAVLGLNPDSATASETPCDTESQTRPLDAHAIPGYELLGVLGHGGMGVVYKVRQVRPRRLAALKMCLAGPHASPEQLARFRVEAE